MIRYSALLSALLSALVAVMISVGLVACESSSSEPEPLAPTPSIKPPTPSIVTPEPNPTTDVIPLLPISGGGMALSAEGIAVVSDPDSNRVYTVNLRGQAVINTLELPGAEPGRVAVDRSRAYVGLRRGGVAGISLSDGTLQWRTPVCSATRGLVEHNGTVWAACLNGDLVGLDAESGHELSRHYLDTDLRDVVAEGDRLYVSRFRSAEVLIVEEGIVVDRWSPPSRLPEEGVRRIFAPTVAWRMRARQGGGVILLHQRSQLNSVIVTRENGYSSFGPCSGGVVDSAVTIFDAEGQVQLDVSLLRLTLAVDAIQTQGGDALLVAAPGGIRLTEIPLNFEKPTDCRVGQHGGDGVFIAVATNGEQQIALTRSPLMIYTIEDGVPTSHFKLADTPVDHGHTLFHQDAGRGIACASCHPEGSDDGHTWLFAGSGLRRTQHLLGGIKGTEPFHWQGDLPGMRDLVQEVMVRRMGATEVTDDDADHLLDWIDTMPAWPAPSVDSEAVDRGKELFEDSDVGCATCHSGALLTDNKPYDVGTGGWFQVPRLRSLANRAPFMHNGCAETLTDRFIDDCGGGDAHGKTSQLNSDQISDLVSYLKTL